MTSPCWDLRWLQGRISIVRIADLVECVPMAYRDVPVASVVADSRAVRPGALFVACRGRTVDGHAFVADAVRAGCRAVLGSERLSAEVAALLRERGVPYLRVEDSAEALGRLAARLQGQPSSALRVVGVTGTNGKTTVTTLLYELFTALGHRSGLIGTTGARIVERAFPASHTTPDAVELQGLLAAMVRSGCGHCFVEVTSHAIDQQRISGVDFAGGIFTTLGHDHLDYHGTIGEYARVKESFLRELPAAAFALSNAEDPCGRFMVSAARAQVALYGSGRDARLPWAVERLDEHGMDVRLGAHRVHTRLIGRHNASNLAAAVTAAILLGEELERVLAAVPSLRGARGRMERVVSGPVLGIVDYAHTPEALRLALAAMHTVRPRGRLLVVGGCGGDRDRLKRPAMGAALAEADLAVLTSDNPRSEDPQAIVEAMLAGVPSPRLSCVRVVLDRRRALRLAAALARPGDIVLVVGKGHETSQEMGDAREPWDDRAELRAALGRIGRRGSPRQRGERDPVAR
jgi:UDP-N-acetylmuramoyl-L-alanyl-D-glutamate--2,6-diaminopimelate ligase